MSADTEIADASGQDHLIEATDNSGEVDAEEAPQGPRDVVDDDEDLDAGEPDA